jgi:recombinational DNA repair protein RecR
VWCDVDQVLVSNPRWSEGTNSNGMEQVRELLTLINHKKLDEVIVAMNFTFR